MSKRRLGASTIAIHGQPHKRPDWTPVVTPVYQSSTFTNPVGSDEEVMYSRYGNNPNQRRWPPSTRCSRAPRPRSSCASGMGATALAHLAVLRPGDHLVSSDWIYGGTKRLFDEEFARFGIEVSYVDPDQPRLWKQACRKTTRAIFVETPTNPLMRVLDLTPMARSAEEDGLALLVDATFASPINFRPLEHGADVVITSATKYLNGHSDVIAGAVAGTAPVIEEVTRLMKLWGQAIDPHAAWLVERGMQHARGARGAAQPERPRGRHLGRRPPRGRQGPLPRAAQRTPTTSTPTQVLDGFGGMVGLELKGGAPRPPNGSSRAQGRHPRPSLGGVETLVSEPRFTSHRR